MDRKEEKKASSPNRVYAAIDLKSFYASVEATARRLDPLDACLVVADPSRTDKTICLAVSPALKTFGIPGRLRLFEVKQKLREVNRARRIAYGKNLEGRSFDLPSISADPSLAVDFVIATPRMKEYMRISSKIYSIYLRFVSKEDVHVYSIDEVFIDLTSYLSSYGMSPYELVKAMVKKVYEETGITATAGIGTNLYLAKVAMDILAKHEEADEFGVRIAYLDERKYRESLWEHTPLTDFWRVGRGYMSRLGKYGVHTMGDIALLSLRNEDLLYEEFGINAELLIDHAWGSEIATIKDIKGYKPRANSLSSGQVLAAPYNASKAKIVVKEMADTLSLDLAEKGLYAKQLCLILNFEAVSNDFYKGEKAVNRYGKIVPKPERAIHNFVTPTHLSSAFVAASSQMFDKAMKEGQFVRAIYLYANDLIDKESREKKEGGYVQLSLFDEFEGKEETKAEEASEEKEESLQQAILSIQRKYGKNSLLKGNDLMEGATKRERNGQVGGHKG